MLTIHLDPEIVFDDVGPFFVPVPTVPCFGSPTFDPHPTAEWVAAGEPCQTCGHASTHKNRCPDCIDGKPRIAITVPMLVESSIETADVWSRVVVPDVWAVIEHGPLPIVDTDDRDDAYPCIVVAPSGVFLVPRTEDVYEIDLGSDPASLIGTWGAICRVATS